MTIVEFFDSEMLENIIGTLMFRPKKVILFGSDIDKMNAFKKRMARILSKNKIPCEIIVRSVTTDDYFSVFNMLNEFACENPDCIFDLTGGEELILTAMGAVSAKNNIPLRSINLSTNISTTFYYDKGEVKEKKSCHLSVCDIVSLFGGNVSFDPENTIRKNTNISRDLTALWYILRKNTSDWNVAVEAVSTLIDSVRLKKDGLTFSVPKNYFNNKSASHKLMCLSSLLSSLISKKLLVKTVLENEIRYTFKNRHIYYALSKAGTVLELYTLFSVLSIKNDDKKPFVTDAVSGAIIDWDNPHFNADDVKNEIDVLATVGLIPVFISCKNGSVDSAELYKLNTVAERFGGKYAKKILIMTSYNLRPTFIRRARKMNIKIIRNVHTMGKEEFLNQLKQAMEN